MTKNKLWSGSNRWLFSFSKHRAKTVPQTASRIWLNWDLSQCFQKKNKTKNKKLDLPWASGDPGDVTLVISAGEAKLVTIEAELWVGKGTIVRKIKQFSGLLGYKLEESGEFAAHLYTKYSRYLFYNVVRILVSKLSQSFSTEYMGTSTYSIISAKKNQNQVTN